jgi:hypothetical protein|tara:strand:- start:1 stop:450 length:450 start_codon:yes stop_codon:yes gene_type:complete
MIKFLITLVILSLSNIANTQINECSAKMIQVMKPTHPDTNYQGYAVVQFNVDKQGMPKDIKAVSSNCASTRDSNDKIVLKTCPFFKTNAVNATKYMRFNPPTDDDGNSCEIKNKTHEYKFSLFNFNLEYDDFFLREDIKKTTSSTDSSQ